MIIGRGSKEVYNWWLSQSTEYNLDRTYQICNSFINLRPEITFYSDIHFDDMLTNFGAPHKPSKSKLTACEEF